jgi:hypothetical protein
MPPVGELNLKMPGVAVVAIGTKAPRETFQSRITARRKICDISLNA